MVPNLDKLQTICFLCRVSNNTTPSTLLKNTAKAGFILGYCRKDQIFFKGNSKVADFNTKELGCHFNNTKKYLEIC